LARILFNHVKKRYGKEKDFVVKDFTLEVEDQEFLVFVGPSGCGKSTVLRMLAGLEDISEGEIYIDDQLVNDMPPKDRDISMVFQNYALYPNMSVFENIAFGLRLRKLPKHEIEQSVNRAARMLELDAYLHRMPRELSGGQRQRVALGRAIVRNPQAFLMDEPLSNLDAKLRVQMRAEIIDLQRKIGVTTIYVTHDQVEAMTMGDRIVILNRGVIQQVGTPVEVYERPVNMFVAGFIGSPPINFIEGKVVEREGRLQFQTRRFYLPLLPQQAELVRAHRLEDQDAVLGIRAENIDLSADSVEAPADEKAIVVGGVAFSEFVGSDRYCHLDIGAERRMIARVHPGVAHGAGESATAVLDMRKALLFRRDTGMLIT